MGIFDGLFSGSSEEPAKSKQGGLLAALDPTTIGLLSAASAGMIASGPSTRPVSFGQVMGNMIHGGLLGYTGAEDGRIKREEHQQMADYRKAQISALNQKMTSDKEMDDFFKTRLLGGSSAFPGMSGLSSATATAGSSPMDMPGAAPASSSKVGGMPAAQMGGEVFYQAASKAGLGTDHSTLNRIVSLVNQGMSPDEAAQSIAGKAGAGISPMGMQSMGAATPGLPGMGAAPGIPQQMQGNAFPFSLNDIAYMKLKGKDLTDIYKLASDPIKLESGSTYVDRATGQRQYMPKIGEGMQMGPNGVSLAPGYLDSMGAVKGAEAFANERAKASLDPFYSVDPQGNKVLAGSRLNALGGGRGGPGFPPSNQPGMPGGIVTERSPAANAYDQDVAKDLAARYASINKAGFTAPSQIAKLQRINQLLADHEGGKFSQNGLEMAQYANSLGFKVDKNLANKEAAVALSNELALSLRDPSNGGGMPGAMSDADRTFLSSMAPGLAQSKEGRQQMVDASIALQKRNQQVAEMARKYSKKYGRVDDGFYTQLQSWADRNPLFGGQ